jgi:hypothetical protein
MVMDTRRASWSRLRISIALEPDGWPGCGSYTDCKPTQERRLSQSTFWTGHRSTASLTFTLHHLVEGVEDPLLAAVAPMRCSTCSAGTRS